MKSLGSIIALAAFATMQCVAAFKPLTDVQRNLAYQITATWENQDYDSSSKSWTLHYDYCEDIDDGQGITIGFTGFTTNGGDAKDMLNHYKRIDSSNVFEKVDSLDDCLRKVEDSSNVGCFKCKDDNCHSSTLCSAAKHAINNDKDNYVQAQHDQDDTDNWKTSQALSKKYGISLPLSQAFIYDSCVNHACMFDGNDVEGYIIKHALDGDHKVGSSLSDQKKFFSALLHSRKNYMCSDGCDCCDESGWRMGGWKWLGTKGYWNLPNPMSIKALQDGSDAKVYTFKCNPEQHPGCGKGKGGGGGGKDKGGDKGKGKGGKGKGKGGKGKGKGGKGKGKGGKGKGHHHGHHRHHHNSEISNTTLTSP